LHGTNYLNRYFGKQMVGLHFGRLFHNSSGHPVQDEHFSLSVLGLTNLFSISSWRFNRSGVSVIYDHHFRLFCTDFRRKKCTSS
jgi:hypothetical protein